MEKHAIELLKTLIKIPSFETENKIAEFLIDYFQKELPEFSFQKVYFGKKRVNLFFTNSLVTRILFACHTDTVFPSSFNQLKPIVKEDKIFGLGAKDMKGGIVSTLLALKETKKKGVGILFYGDEEKKQRGIKKIAQKANQLFPNKPILIISPESRFDLGYGARGFMTIKIVLKGKRAHSARPFLGNDAINGLYSLTDKLKRLLKENESPLGETIVTINWSRGGLLTPQGKISYHPGTIPDVSEAIISIRNANPNIRGKKVISLCQKIAKSLNLKFEGIIKEDYPARLVEKQLVQKVKKIIENTTNKTIKLGDPKLAGYNDVAILGQILKTPVINFGPYGENNHTANEWVNLESVINTAKAFGELIKNFLS